MTGVVEPTETLSQRMAGRVVVEGDPDYDEVRRVWNASFDRRPAIVAMCRSTEDVAAAVTYAVEHSLEISVRGGAHSSAGLGVGDAGMTINLSEMDAVEVDPVARRARVAGGALLRDLDAATQEHALAVPAGMVSHTGVGGLTLGGGMGWLTRMLGMSIDHLVSARVVVADGSVLRAADDENPGLFWALRGGGGNFGVVTEFEFALHPVGPMVWFSMLFYPLEQAVEAMRVARDLVADLPREANLVLAAVNAPPAPFVPPEHHFRPGYAIMLAGFGAEEEHAATAGRARVGLAPLFEMSTPMPYTGLQQLIDEATAWGMHGYEKGAYLPGLTDEVIEVVAEHVARKPTPMSQAVFYVLDGAYSEVPDDATAFGGGRSPRIAIFIVGETLDAAEVPTVRAWARGFHAALAPHGLGGVYVNATSDEQDRVVATFGAKYERLARIKGEVDPGNVFHRNANILPTPR